MCFKTAKNEGRRILHLICLVVVMTGSAFASSPAFAKTGAQLLVQCSAAANKMARLQCESYVSGVVDGIRTLTSGMRIISRGNGKYPRLFCIPAHTKSPAIASAVVHYLVAHSREQHFGAPSEIILALQAAYPCRRS